jgi:hypothetical protein
MQFLRNIFGNQSSVEKLEVLLRKFYNDLLDTSQVTTVQRSEIEKINRGRMDALLKSALLLETSRHDIIEFVRRLELINRWEQLAFCRKGFHGSLIYDEYKKGYLAVADNIFWVRGSVLDVKEDTIELNYSITLKEAISKNVTMLYYLSYINSNQEIRKLNRLQNFVCKFRMWEMDWDSSKEKNMDYIDKYGVNRYSEYNFYRIKGDIIDVS